MKMAAILLAAGGSRRLGQPKQLVEVGGVPAVRRQAARLMEAGVDDLIVVTGCRGDEVASALEGLGVRAVDNPDWETGMASSLVSGVREVAPDSAILIAACDQLRLEPSDYRTLMACARRCPEAVVASGYNDILGVPAVFPPAWRQRLLALRGDQGARRLIAEADTVTVALENAAFDLDTPEQLKGLFLG